MPPFETINNLNASASKDFSRLDSQIFDYRTLMDHATKARNARQWSRSERLARRAMNMRPNSEAAAAVLSAALRALGKPSEALAVTDGFKRSSSVALLTTRAAALCDVGQWREARNTISVAFAVGGDRPAEAFSVLARIRAAAPQFG